MFPPASPLTERTRTHNERAVTSSARRLNRPLARLVHFVLRRRPDVAVPTATKPTVATGEWIGDRGS